MSDNTFSRGLSKARKSALDLINRARAEIGVDPLERHKAGAPGFMSAKDPICLALDATRIDRRVLRFSNRFNEEGHAESVANAWGASVFEDGRSVRMPRRLVQFHRIWLGGYYSDLHTTLEEIEPFE